MDYEAATWRAVQEVFPTADVKGCAFHWGQAVMRKVAALGLKSTYNQRKSTHHLIRKLLALPFLPADHITPALTNLSTAATTPALEQLFDYVTMTWTRSSVWSVSQWSVFRQPVRTNNDTEGWHRRLDTVAGGTQVPFYRLVPTLKDEADYVDIQMRLVDEQQLTRYQQQTYRRIHGRLNDLWDQYEAKTLKTSDFLRAVGMLLAHRVPDTVAADQ